MRRLLPLLAVLLLAAEDARASCAPPNPRAQLKYSDAAFDGRFESNRYSADRTERWLTFRVDRVFKGQLGETVEIYQRGVSTIGFGHFEPGQRVALMINFENGAWLSNDCLRSDPEELADAVRPLPRPPGRGRAAFLVMGSFGDATAILLDRRGRALAYGSAGGHHASICPGGRRIVVAGTRGLMIRRTRDLRLVRRIRLGNTQRLHCLRDTIVRATTTGLFRGARRIWRGAWTGMTFHGRTAFVARRHEILRVDLVSGRERSVARLPLTPTQDEVRTLEVSPDGRRIAVLAPDWTVPAPTAQLLVVDPSVSPARIHSADVPEGKAYRTLAWAGADRLVVTAITSFRAPAPAQPARFYDARLRPLGEVAGWTALPVAGAAGAAVGVLGHRLERATPAGASELSRLPGSWVWSLHRLPGVEVRASRRVPRY